MSFTQADLNAGRVIYVHAGSELPGDSFQFSVADPVGGTIGTTTFTITVSPVNDAPVAAADAYPVNEDSALLIPPVRGGDSFEI